MKSFYLSFITVKYEITATLEIQIYEFANDFVQNEASLDEKMKIKFQWIIKLHNLAEDDKIQFNIVYKRIAEKTSGMTIYKTGLYGSELSWIELICYAWLYFNIVQKSLFVPTNARQLDGTDCCLHGIKMTSCGIASNDEKFMQ